MNVDCCGFNKFLFKLDTIPLTTFEQWFSGEHERHTDQMKLGEMFKLLLRSEIYSD